MALIVLSAGVDSLYVSFAGRLQPELLERMEELKQEARSSGQPAPIAFEDGRATVVLPHGWGFYPYSVHCSDFDLHLTGSEHVPPVYLRLSSLFIHSVGCEAAAATAVAFVRDSLMQPAKPAAVSRIDVYADFQGWIPVVEDFNRFVTRSVTNQAYFEPVQVNQSGQRLSGFRFGKGSVVARLYDKGQEIQVSGKDWMRDVWGSSYDTARPIWRLEFQVRREAVGDFNVQGVDEVLACRQDFWRYGLRWLSLRDRSEDQQRDRWPVTAVWQQLSQISMGAPLAGVLRRRVREHQERILVRGLAGYVTSLAALLNVGDEPRAYELAARKTHAYLIEQKTTFGKVVRRKRAALV
jgi:hypothetical protein